MSGDFRYLDCSMKAKLLTLLLASLLLPILSVAQVGSSVVQNLTVEVKPITKIAVTSNPGALFITDTQVGSDVMSVSDDNSKYSMVPNVDNMKIVASINNEMPTGTKLMVRLESSSGLSNGFVDVSNARSPVEVVSGLGKGSDLNK